MKNLKKTGISLAVVVICYFLSKAMGFEMEELIANIHINVEAVIKVTLTVAFLSAIKYVLKLLVSLIKNEKAATFVTIAQSAIDYVTLILMVIWSLRLLGADINGIIAGLGILALIIGTSAEGIIEDLLTGLFLLFEKEYKVGDIIEVDGFLGKVTEIGIRTTTIVDGGGSERIINNSSMKDIINRSANNSVAVVDISVPTDTDIEKLIKADYGDITCLGLEEIGSEDLTVRFIKETEEENIYETRRSMNVAILKKLKKLGIK
ncbi:MAG: mechanosensitive ion channel [Erysipelotrichaceae bacterium]|nr:mechanosensitive ion channel [Erysipelotrichaceae bacterium]